MTKLTDLEGKFELVARTDELHLFKYTEHGITKEIPVIFEASKFYGDDRKPSAEYFRARAMTFQPRPEDFCRFLNAISVTVCHETRMVRFGPTFRLDMDRRGIGLGSALMSAVIGWLQSKGFADYRIEQGTLGAADADSDEARLRRNRFYMKFGFQVSSWDGKTKGDDVVEGFFGQDGVGDLSQNLSAGTELVRWRDDWSKRETRLFDSHISGLGIVRK